MDLKSAKVALFVDIENLAKGMRNLGCQIVPEDLVTTAARFGQVVHAKCFGDFREPIIADLKEELRAATLDVVDVPSQRREDGWKQFTDFAMLDDIYQVLFDYPDVDTFVVAAGDGHFSGVVARLRIRHGKRVIVMGVEGGINHQLRAVASHVEELSTIPAAIDPGDLHRLLSFMAVGEDQGKVITFSSTLKHYRALPRSMTRQALQQLLDGGRLARDTVDIDGTTIKTLRICRDHPENSFLNDPDFAQKLSSRRRVI
ncbi:MAG: NYN domain-containing protein [Bacillota bacterium]